ncbi:MAG: translation factor SUA5, partial [Clostridia bacterium]|nr:translation factor SUA5 [Clostridia bacterium]
TADMLASVCRKVMISPAVVEPALADHEKPESPGMKYKHYAPNAELILIDADDDDFFIYVNDHGREDHGVFVADEDEDRPIIARPLLTGKKGDAAEISHRFFTLLRTADEMNLKVVYAKLPPAEGEYLALYNRIVRAAGCRILKLGKRN